ncbi:MAG: UDP-N-acetylmuramoyl-tripeptide--D-alanyl-D-alanine ligase [Armatimonadetes bacterium]|nr:UDP-N-acetylmuramoyl-tripeptide--D-alanyl-D-alanine ligase [Armatimonadota bacterium]
MSLKVHSKLTALGYNEVQVIAMVPLPLKVIADWVEGKLLNSSGDERIMGVTTDSRKVSRGDLFLALKGERFDGHDFINDAIQKGSVAAIVSRLSSISIPQILVADTLLALGKFAAKYLCHLRQELKKAENFNYPLVIAVTGSSGKTTTKGMVASVLEAEMPVVVSPESFNNEIGVPLTVLQANFEHQALVLEYAMRKKGDIRYLCKIAPPQIAAITNIGTAHIGLLGSRQAIAEAKAEILGDWGLSESCWQKDFAEVAILPADDDFFNFLKAKAKGEVISFGFSSKANVRAISCQVDWEGTTITATNNKQTVKFNLPVWGEHNALNSLIALSVAMVLGIDWDKAVEALKKFQPPKMRLQRLWLSPPNCWVINDAYNANPDSVKAALRTIKALPAERKVAVLGEMLELGEFHEQGHKEVGQVVAETVDFLIVIGENALGIAEGAQNSGMPSERIVKFANMDEAKEQWRNFLSQGDLVLLKASRAIGLERLLDE